MTLKAICRSTLRVSGRLRLLLPIGLALLAPADRVDAVDAGEYVVIVNKDNPETQLSTDELSDIYLGKVAEWPNGWHLEPLDQSLQSEIRLAFTKAVHKKSVGAVNRYWMNQVYSGRNKPPKVMNSDEKITAFISANPGAIGYVRATLTSPGVRVLSVVD